MGHHGNHFEFCGQSKTWFWGPKIFLIKYVTKKEHFKKNFFKHFWREIYNSKMMDFWNEQKVCIKSVHM